MFAIREYAFAPTGISDQVAVDLGAGTLCILKHQAKSNNRQRISGFLSWLQRVARNDGHECTRHTAVSSGF